ncbi:MAG: HAD-IA family hydrolase [Planctomycetota bacterium]
MLDLRRFEVLSFDCYGTLIDWESGILSALRPVLLEHGVHVSDERLLELYAVAESDAESIEDDEEHASYRLVLQRTFSSIAWELGIEPTAEERDCLVDSLPGWKPFPDTVEALQRLEQRYRLAIISNVDDNLIAKTQEHLKVEFHRIVTAESCRSYKPSRLIFERALERIGVRRDRLLHVAQSLYHDISPISTLGIATVHLDRQTGRGAGATPKVEARAKMAVPDLWSLAELADRSFAGGRG